MTCLPLLLKGHKDPLTPYLYGFFQTQLTMAHVCVRQLDSGEDCTLYLGYFLSLLCLLFFKENSSFIPNNINFFLLLFYAWCPISLWT